MGGHDDIRSLEDPFANEGGAHKPLRVGIPVDPLRLLAVVRRSWKWLLVAAVVGAPIGYFVSKALTPPRYRSTATLVYEGVPEVPGLPDTRHGELGALLDSVVITPNLEEVGRALKLDEPPELLKRSIEVGQTPGSNAFKITASARSAGEAAAVANKLVEVFQEHRREVEKARLSEHLASIDNDLDLARKTGSLARTRYDEFRERHGIADLSVEQEQAITAAAELQAAAGLAEAEARAQDVRLKQLQGAARRMRSTTLLSSTRTSPAESDLAEAQSKLAASRAQLSDDHPRVRALEAQVRALQERASREKGVVLDTVTGANPAYQTLETDVTGTAADREAAHKREESLEALTKAARQRVAELSRVEGEASTLLASVEVAEAHIADLEGMRARVEGAARSPVSGFRVVAEARPSDAPEGANVGIAVVVAMPLALALLVAGVISLRELRGFRVATPAEIAYWGNGPVVGTTSWPANPDLLAEFVAELDDHLPRSSGRTLIVPALDGDRGLVAELACQLSEGWHPIVVDGDEAASIWEDEEADAIVDSVVADAVAVEQVEVVGAVDERRQEADSVDAEEGPPSGAPAAQSVTALAMRPPDTIVELGAFGTSSFEAKGWVGPKRGPRLRRAARLADRVVVLVRSRSLSAFELKKRVTQLGRNSGVGFVVVGADETVSDLPDRVGDVKKFWRSTGG